jgi:NADH-quinone oxidoreductase subunit D
MQRLDEINKSLTIINTNAYLLLPFYKKGSQVRLYTNSFKIVAPSNSYSSSVQTMESVIHDFKMFSRGYVVTKGKGFVSIDAPKGEYGVTLVGYKSHRP